MPTAAEFLTWCRAQLNTREHPPGSNRTLYHAAAGHRQDSSHWWPWCGVFLEAGAKATGLALPGHTHYTPDGYAAFRRAGRAGRTPRVGAFAYLYYPSLGRIGHVGVVEVVHADGRVTTIEGNTSTGGSRTGIGVFRQRRRALVPNDGRHSGIVGYGYPSYRQAGSGAPAFPGREYFRPGAKNKYVTMLGERMVALGFGRHYRTGPGPEWSEADRRAVAAFQRSRPELAADADGYPGPLTWKLAFPGA